MPITQVSAPDGSVIQVQHPEGASKEQILQYAYLKYLDERGMSPVSEDEVPTPMEEPVGPSVVRERPEITPEQRVVGALETLATLGTGATTGFLGQLGGTLQGLSQAILQGQFGTQEGVRLVEQYAQRGAEAGTFAPRTEAGREMVEAVGEPLAQLPPVLGAPAPVGAPLVRGVGPQIRAAMPSVADEMARAAQAADEAASRARRAIGERLDIRPTLRAEPEDIAAAQARGIRVMTTDVVSPETFASKWLQATGERIPVAGTGGIRAAQQRERVSAVENLMREYEVAEAVPIINEVATDLIETRSANLNRFKDAKTEVIEGLKGTGSVPVENTIKAIDAEIKQLESLKTADVEPVVSRLNDWRSALQDQGIVNVEKLRKQIGESFKAPELASVRGIGEASLSKIYRPLRDEMTQFIKDNASEQDFTKWQVSNKRLAELAGELKQGSLRNALRKGEQTPEAVGALLFSNKPSDVKALYRNLSPLGRGSARVAILNRAAQKAGGIENISPQRFATEVKKLSEQVGVFFDKPELDKVNGLVRALDLTDRAQLAAVAPPTGVQAVPFVAGSFLADMFGSAGAAVTTAGTVGVLARAYESKALRPILTRLGKAKKGSAEEQTIFGEFQEAIAKELAKIAPATVPEAARVQLQELEESEQ